MPQYTDTNVNQLVINKMTKAQYESITPSDTELYLVPDEIDSTPTSGSDNPVTSGGVYTALQDKADKVSNATNDNFAGLDANGNLTDSGYSASDFVSSSSLPAYTIARLGTPETGYFASYVLQKDGVQEGATINIPKDYLVKSGSVIDVVEYNGQYYDATDTTHTTPLPVSAAGKYLDFVVNTVDSSGASSHIYIAVNDLVDAYTEGNGIDISNLNVVSIQIDSSNSNGLSVSSNGLALATAVASSGGVGGSNGAITAADKEKLNGLRKMAIMEYGLSTWNDLQNALSDNAVVYCKASSNANPAVGEKRRMAFLAYLGTNNVEFQYYRSVSSHSATQQGDQVYVYTLSNNSIWSVTVRESYTKIVAGTNLTSSYSNGALNINADAISDKADKVVGATSGDIAKLDAAGNLVDSGVSVEDILSQIDDSEEVAAAAFNDLNKRQEELEKTFINSEEATSAAINDLYDRLPTSVSQLQNDCEYITQEVLEDYVGTLDTTATTAQSTSSSESLGGSVTLHKISKTGTYSDLIGKPTYAQGVSEGGIAVQSARILYGVVDGTSTSTAFTATINGVTALADGVCIYLTNNVVSSEAGYTININNLGAKPVYLSNAASSQSETNFAQDTTFLFVYNSTRVSGGCWDLYYAVTYTSVNTAYQIRTNHAKMPVVTACYRYRLLFTSPDGAHYVPANASTSTSATSSKTVTTEKIDPFGDIVCYNNTPALSAGSSPNATYLYRQVRFTLGYSFNRTGAALTLTAQKPVYIKCSPQSDGSVKIDGTTPYVQDLPTTEDSYVYIFLGIATAATYVELLQKHPVYYYKNGCVRQWTNMNVQETLVSGTNIKTIDNVSLLGSGNIAIASLIPTISTNVATDKDSNAKTASAKAVYDEVHPQVGTSQPVGGFLPNVLYNLGTISDTVTFTMASPTDSYITNIWYWTFDTGSTAPTITWPSGVTWSGGSAPSVNINKHYEISVLNGIGVYMEV